MVRTTACHAVGTGSIPVGPVIYSIRLAGRWRLPYKQKQPWFESKIEYEYRDLVQLEERQSPKLHVGSPNLSVPANFMGVPKSWRSSSVCKTDGYAFDGPNPSTPTILYSTLAQLVERATVNRMVPGSSPGGGAMPVSPSGQWLEPVNLPF